ncbi:MAG: hypothetical protein Q9164_007566, partial [Protoblastenia rupestris]
GHRTPFWIASRNHNGNRDLMDTVRLFLDCVDFSDPSCDGWNIIFNFADNYGGLKVDDATSLTMFEWIVKQHSQEMKANLIASEYAPLLEFLVVEDKTAEFYILLRLGPEGAINTFLSDGFNLLLNSIAWAFKNSSDLLRCGADPYCVGLNTEISPKLESPTSLAMYSSRAFALWRSSVSDAGIDIDNVIGRVLEKGPLFEAGWTRKTLRILFDWDNEITDPHNWTCSVCGTRIWCLMIQPLWLYALEEIKNGTSPEDTLWELYSQSDAEFDSDFDTMDSSHAHQKIEGELVPVSEAPDLDEETESLKFQQSRPAAGTSLCPADAFSQEAKGENVPGSETSDLDTEATDFVNTNSESSSDVPTFIYTREDLVCSCCWFHPHQGGKRGEAADIPRSDFSSDMDTSLEDDYSPFHLHS